MEPSRCPPTSNVRLTDLNEFLSCPVCHGYLIDATTVSECLHTFCKSCIVKHIKNDNNECPKCNTVIHDSRPMEHILYDRSKQDIVYKLVPQLYISEMNRKLAMRDLQEIDPYTRFGLKEKFIYVTLVRQKRKHFRLNDIVGGSHSNTPPATAPAQSDTSNNNNDLKHIYLSCPLNVRVLHIRKLLAVKFQLEADDRLVLFYKGDIINDYDQISNLAQSISFVIHYEISRLYPTIEQRASTSSSTISTDSDKMSIDEIN